MKMPARIAVAVMGIGLLPGCATALIATEDRGQICEVSVADNSGSPAFRANPYSNPVTGPVGGAGTGAAAGAVASLYFLPMAIVTVPLGAVMGAVSGTACAAAAAARPTAEAEFQQLIGKANAGGLKQALQGDLNARRPECSRREPNAPGAGTPDTVVEIDKVELGMGCAFGKQNISITVQWRAMGATDRKLLGQTTTRCGQGSSRDVDEWFADMGQARAEIDHLLVRAGQRIAAELLSPKRLPPCSFLPATTDDSGEK
jgi:hypothetical protein